MRLTLSTLAVLASLSPACAEERVWSGFDSTDGKVTNYKLTIRGPHSGTEAYVIAHQTGFTTCYILLDKILDTDAQVVLIGLPSNHPESFGGTTQFPACASVGWFAGEKLSLKIYPLKKTMDVVVDGAVVHTVSVE